MTPPRAPSGELTTTTRVAFLGNSIQYFNDCPRLLQHMMCSTTTTDNGERTNSSNAMIQDSCLRGGASFESLWTKGNGMAHLFKSPNDCKEQQSTSTNLNQNSDNNNENNKEYDITTGAPTVQALLSAEEGWDFVVMNDYTQQPARAASREVSIDVLNREYAPLLRQCGGIPVFIQTPAYRLENIKGTADLGTTHEFTRLLEEGLQIYMEHLGKTLLGAQQGQHQQIVPRMAPVGNAYLSLHDSDRPMWEKLFCADCFHPTPHGTWLQACVLYCTLVNRAPPMYNVRWWDTARYRTMDAMQPPFPNNEDARQLRQVAMLVCNIRCDSHCY